METVTETAQAILALQSERKDVEEVLCGVAECREQ